MNRRSAAALAAALFVVASPLVARAYSTAAVIFPASVKTGSAQPLITCTVSWDGPPDLSRSQSQSNSATVTCFNRLRTGATLYITDGDYSSAPKPNPRATITWSATVVPIPAGGSAQTRVSFAADPKTLVGSYTYAFTTRVDTDATGLSYSRRLSVSFKVY